MQFINDIKENLLRSSMDYLRIGLAEFHKIEKSSNDYNIQPVLGILSISIELMLKAIIAFKSFDFLFSNLPNEYKIYLRYPHLVKESNIERAMKIKFLHSSFNTIELSECISIFNILYPEKKIEFSNYFKTLNIIRNASLHFNIPKFQKYDLGRIALFSILIYNILDTDNGIMNVYYKLNDNDKQFFKDFNDERNNIVKEKIENARVKALKTTNVHLETEEWNELVSKCPICSNDCLLFGETDEYVEVDSDGGGQLYLIFSADALKCDQCGLELSDSEELRLANVENSYDRDEISRWVEEHYDGYFEYDDH